MKTTLFLFSFVTMSLLAASQPTVPSAYEWIWQIGGSGHDHGGVIAVDDTGNVYATGSFVGQVILGSDTLSSLNSFTQAPFAVKLDTHGNVVWARTLPVTSPQGGRYDWKKITLSASGKIFLLGNITYNGTNVAYFLILRNDGSLVSFSDQYGSQTPQDMDLDSADNVYITGQFDGSSPYSYVLKFDSTGVNQWGYTYYQPSTASNIRYINGQVYVTGQFNNQLELVDSFGNVMNLNATNGINDWDVYMVHYDTDGQLLYVNTYDGLPVGITGPSTLAGDFDQNGQWRISWTSTTSDVKFRRFSPTLSPMPSTTMYTPACASTLLSFDISPYNGNLSISNYSGDFLSSCAAPTFHLVDSLGQVVRSIGIPLQVPFFGEFMGRGFAVDSLENLYINSGIQGSYKYADSSGLHTLVSSQNSRDILIGKYRNCPQYSPIVMQYGDSLVCTQGGMNYQWYFGNSPLATEVNQYYIANPNSPGDYYVVMRDSNGCGALADIAYSHIPNGISSPVANKSWSVYPNPATEKITVEGLTSRSLVTIVDVIGRVILKETLSSNRTLNISTLSKGIYFVQSEKGITELVIF